MNLSPLALAPEYFVFRSLAVFAVFLLVAALPTVVVASRRGRLSRGGGIGCLVAATAVLIVAFPELHRLSTPAAIEYWGFWCAVLVVLSSVLSLLVVRSRGK